MEPKEQPRAKRMSAFERFAAAILGVPKPEADALDGKRSEKAERETAAPNAKDH